MSIRDFLIWTGNSRKTLWTVLIALSSESFTSRCRRLFPSRSACWLRCGSCWRMISICKHWLCRAAVRSGVSPFSFSCSRWWHVRLAPVEVRFIGAGWVSFWDLSLSEDRMALVSLLIEERSSIQLCWLPSVAESGASSSSSSSKSRNVESWSATVLTSGSSTIVLQWAHLCAKKN